eukprot:scaffold84258_cov22-Tisochrysis_lutea.AAC.1
MPVASVVGVAAHGVHVLVAGVATSVVGVAAHAWGSNSQSRVGRQQIPHQIYKDANNVEHVRALQNRTQNGTTGACCNLPKTAEQKLRGLEQIPKCSLKTAMPFYSYRPKKDCVGLGARNAFIAALP